MYHVSFKGYWAYGNIPHVSFKGLLGIGNVPSIVRVLGMGNASYVSFKRERG